MLIFCIYMKYIFHTDIHTYISIDLDIDECIDIKDGCSQICANTIESLICGCNDGYLLDIDGVTCYGMQ